MNCCYCNRKLNKNNKKTKEHIIPKSKGGTDNKFNIAYSCFDCNNIRGNMDLIDFKSIIFIHLQNKDIKLRNYTRVDLLNIYHNLNQNK